MNEKSGIDSDFLYECILALKDKETLKNFFEDLCTIQELSAITQRLEVAKMLKSGATYNQVASETGSSTATISRVNRSLSYGTGGYEAVFKIMKEKFPNE